MVNWCGVLSANSYVLNLECQSLSMGLPFKFHGCFYASLVQLWIHGSKCTPFCGWIILDSFKSITVLEVQAKFLLSWDIGVVRWFTCNSLPERNSFAEVLALTFLSLLKHLNFLFQIFPFDWSKSAYNPEYYSIAASGRQRSSFVPMYCKTFYERGFRNYKYWWSVICFILSIS